MAVATMTVGETSLFTIKPEYAYGQEGSGNKIPPNATLQFNITLVEWKGEDVTRDGQVTKIVLEKGEGYDFPNTGAICEGQHTRFFFIQQDFVWEVQWPYGWCAHLWIEQSMFEPWLVHCCVLWQDTLPSQCLSPKGV